MIDLFTTTQGVLREAGYAVELADLSGTPVICFEDDSLAGFCVTFADAATLLRDWKQTELKILTRFAPSIRTSGEKAWNVYVVFLTSDAGDEKQARAVHWIEEDLDRTRKIAATSIDTREVLVQSLLAILPLQQQPVIEPEDAMERLQKRIQAIAPVAEKVFFDESVPPIEIVRLLEGSR